MKFSKILHKTRLEKGFSAQEIADKIGVSLRSYRFYESGHSNPKLTTLIKIADTLDVSVDYLLGRTKNKTMKNY